MSTTPDGLSRILAPLGRFLFAAIFLGSAVNKITNTAETVTLMESQGIPAAGVLVYGAIAFLLLGGVSVVVGAFTRVGATLLAIFLALATYYFHDFWTVEDAAKRGAEMIAFLKNVALLGALFLLMANGPGPFSVDAWRSRRTDAEPA